MAVKYLKSLFPRFKEFKITSPSTHSQVHSAQHKAITTFFLFSSRAFYTTRFFSLVQHIFLFHKIPPQKDKSSNMQLSTLLATTTLASGALALSIPSVNLWPRASLTVSSDTGSVNVDVTAATDSDVGGKADAASAVAGVVNQVVQLIQGMVDDDIKRRQAFTQNTAARTQAALGGNVIVSNVGYALDSTNSKTFSTSYNAKIGSDVT